MIITILITFASFLVDKCLSSVVCIILVILSRAISPSDSGFIAQSKFYRCVYTNANRPVDVSVAILRKLTKCLDV